MKFQFNDGGRAEAGYKGNVGDCVCRAIAIAADLPYQEVYTRLFVLAKTFASSGGRCKVSKLMAKAKPGSKWDASPGNGVHKKVYEPYLTSLGFKWFPIMKIGSGCTVHLRPGELPGGTLIVRVSCHLTTVIDGVIHDTYDCSRNEDRCVYGYYYKSETK